MVKLEMCWLSWRSGGQVGVVVAKLEMKWPSWRCGC